MFSREEPRTGVDGTLAWAVDIDNPASGEAFTLTLKEVQSRRSTPRGRPCHPTLRDRLRRQPSARLRRAGGLLSLDMRVIDPAGSA